MDRLKRCRFLFILAIILALVFAALLFIPFVGDNKLLRLAMLAGWISQILQAKAMYSEIRKIKKGKEN
jgi:succinate-acetate transporter protein